MESFFRLSLPERRLQFLYLLAALCLLTFLVSFIMFRDDTYSGAESKLVSDKIKQQEQMLKSQRTHMPLLESTYRAIAAFQPQVRAVFVEAEIDDQLNTIKRLSSSQLDNTRFRSFAQIADFYRMMYNDKRIVWSKQLNSSMFKKRADDCSVGMIANTAPDVAPSTTPIQSTTSGQ